MRIILLLSILLFSQISLSQCVWSDNSNDSFEYTTTINEIIPGSVYQNTPQTFAGCIRSGARGMYLNIVNGYIGLLYSRNYTNLCIGKQYRFSFSTRDAFTSSNNLKFDIYDGNNVLILSQNVITNAVWQDITMAAFTATTSSVRFEISTNIAGGPGNDAAIDDLALEWCNPVPTNVNVQQCNTGIDFDLYPLIQNSLLSSNGSWTGPAPLTNGYLGNFDAQSSANGTYTYTITGGANCPDSVATVMVTLVNTPDILPFSTLESCGTVVLPAITGTGLTGAQKYYSQPNGAGTQYLAGQTVNNSIQLYAYDGLPGCSDQEILNVTIYTPSNAGTDNGASYCGPGQMISLPFFLSANASAGGTWILPANLNPATFSPATGVWNTSTVLPDDYTFIYQVNGVGTCPADQAQFLIQINNMPLPDLGEDTTLCTGQTMWLNPGSFSNYLWNNGSTNPTRFVNTAGTYWVRVGILGDNQVVNGDFEQGATGFSTAYVPGTGGTWGLLSNAGTYAVSSSPSLVHSNFPFCNDHTVAPGVNMLVVNGSSNPNTQVWCQTVPVQPNTTYQFGTWVTSVENSSNVAILQFSVNNSSLGSVFSPSTQGCNWSQFFQTWNSGMTTSAQICVVNQNTSVGGNDFAIDDITFRPICYSYDTIQVAYAPNPVVALGQDQSLCAGTDVLLDAGNSGANFLWNDGSTDQQLNVVSSGAYSVQVTTQFGCTGNDNVNVSFEQSKFAGNDTSVVLCSTSQGLDFNTLLSAGSATDGLWETGNFNGNFTNLGLLSLNGEMGLFDFEYVVSGILCPQDTSHFVLTVNQQPVAAVDQLLHYCNSVNEQIDLADFLNHPSNPSGGAWFNGSVFPAGTFDESSSTLSLLTLDHAVYLVDYVLFADSMCVQDTTHFEIKITAMPQVSFIPSVTSGCQPLEVVFENTSQTQGNISVAWDLGENNYSTQQSGVSVTYGQPICHDVTLTITADGLCTNELTVPNMICVYPLPLADFNYGPHQVYSFDPTVSFDNTSVDNDVNYWTFGGGGTSNSANPTHTFPEGEIGLFEVELIVETVHGCLDSATAYVLVRDELLYYIPNTFTPDGDEFNQIFLPVMTSGFDTFDYKLNIFNRWGELVFETKDINIGWDGSYHGSIVQEGTYTYKIEVGLIDNDDRMVIDGHVNLLR